MNQTSYSFFKNICRTCAKVNKETKILEETYISVENNTIPVIQILNSFTTIMISDNLAHLICTDCLKNISEFYTFKVQCDHSYRILNKYFHDLCEDSLECSTNNNEKEESKQNVCGQPNNDSNKSIFEGEEKICNEPIDTKTVHTNSDNDETFQEKLQKPVSSKENLIQKGKCDDTLPIVCNICKKIFNNRYILSVHEKRHQYKGQFLCTVCGKGFNSQGCLNRHSRVHTGEKKYECDICFRKFPSSNNLRLHYRTHSGVKPYLCSICGKSFSHRTGFTYHTRTHTKEKPYSCEVCGKSFTTQCHFDSHKKIHTGERPFPCSLCDSAFIKKIDLQRHEAVHAGFKPFTCNICDKSFLRKIHLNYHMMVHTNERPHKCDVCGKGFIRRYYLKDHLLKHHGSVASIK